MTDLVDGDDVLQFALLRQESPLAFQLFVADVEQLLVVEQQILHDADLGRQRRTAALLPSENNSILHAHSHTGGYSTPPTFQESK